MRPDRASIGRSRKSHAVQKVAEVMLKGKIEPVWWAIGEHIAQPGMYPGTIGKAPKLAAALKNGEWM